MSRGAAAILAAALMLALTPGYLAAQESPRTRVLVLPFANESSGSRTQWLSEASAILLADDLNALGVSAITREERNEAFDRLQVPPAVSLTDATVIRIGELVGATHIVTGSLTLEGDDVIVRMRRITLDTARAEWLPMERGAVADLFAIFERIARRLAAPGPSMPVTIERPPFAAFENYVKGLVAETPSLAIALLSAALQVHPSFGAPRLALWDLYTDQGEYERALAAVRLLYPSPELGDRARFLAGLSYLSLERFEDAFSVFSAIADRTESAAALNNMGIVELRRDGGGGARAATFFYRAAQADSAQPDYFFNLGYASWLGRDAHAAVYWLREAVRRNPRDGDAHFVLGVALAAVGNQVESAREKDLARRLSSTYAEWEKESGSSAVPEGLERVRSNVELPTTRHVDDLLAAIGRRDQRELATFHLNRARRLYADGRDRDAFEDLDRALFLDPYDADAHLLAARIHLRNGRSGDAIEALKISIWSAETSEGHALMAEALLAEKDFEQARAEADRALTLDPNSADAKRVLDQVAATTTP